MQDGKYYNHRPTFWCRDNDYCMFYHEKLKQWRIFWRVTPGKSSCRLQTRRGPHMASEKWKVWSNEKKEFLEAADMVCRLLTVDELVALAPETILMNSEQLGHCWFEAPGAVGAKRNTGSGNNECFKKTEEMKNGRPVYNAWNEKYNRPVCFKNSKHSCFVSNLSSKWSPLSLNVCLNVSETVESCQVD